MSDPMASQIAGLLIDSDLEELQEIVQRWVAEAPTDHARHFQQQFGAKLLQLKTQFASMPTPPSREDLEVALSMMLKLAAQRR